MRRATAAQIAYIQAQRAAIKAALRAAWPDTPSAADDRAALRKDLARLRTRASRVRSQLATARRSRSLRRGSCRLLEAPGGVCLEIDGAPKNTRTLSALARTHGYRWSFTRGAYVSRGADAWLRGRRLLRAFVAIGLD
jgi:hypothetical protein